MFPFHMKCNKICKDSPIQLSSGPEASDCWTVVMPATCGGAWFLWFLHGHYLWAATLAIGLKVMQEKPGARQAIFQKSSIWIASLVPIPLCWLSSEHLTGPWGGGLGCMCTHLSGMWSVCIKGLISPQTAWMGGLWIHPFTPTLSTSLESSRKAIWLHRDQKWSYLCNLQPVHGYVRRIQRRLG